MKKKIGFILVLFAVMFVAGGCEKYDIPADNDISVTQTSEVSTTDIVETTTLKITESAIDTDIAESINTIQTTTRTTESEILPVDIDMTEEEIYELAMRRADEFQKLFLDFLDYDISELVFSYGVGARGIYVTPDGNEYNVPFRILKHDTIKTYSDLFSLFCETCTPEYSAKLLKFTTHQYTDVDGQLCIGQTENCYMMSGDVSEYVSYEITNDEIILNFVVDIYGPVYGFPPDETEYSLVLKNIDGEWLISNCTTEVEYHCYYWKRTPK